MLPVICITVVLVAFGALAVESSNYKKVDRKARKVANSGLLNTTRIAKEW